MKVLIVSDVLGKENNGTTIACMNLVRYLQKRGDDVRILCADQDKKGLSNYFIVPTRNLGFIINKIVEKNHVSLAKPDKKIIRKSLEGVDIVHVMMPFALCRATVREARKRGIPVTAGFHCQAENFTAHLGLMNSKLANKIVYHSYYKHLYRYVDAIHYPTQFIRDVFEQSIKRKTNGYIISNGVNDIYQKRDVERIPSLKKSINILFIGRYSKEKSHELLIKGVALSKYKDNIQLILAGQGPCDKNIANLSKKLKIKQPIMKFYKRDELVDIINMCDLYAHPAEIEIEAISCLEAITCGLVPIISNSKRSATNAFALSEDNLFKYDSPSDLAKKIDYWIDNPKKREECSTSYLGYTKRFNQDRCMDEMRELLLRYAQNEDSRTPLLKRYYRDELNDDFANNGIVKKELKKNYCYVRKNVFYNSLAWFLVNFVVRPIAILLNKLFYRQRIIGRKRLKGLKKQGYFIYANHTANMADAYTPNILNKKRNHTLVSLEAVSIPIVSSVVRMMGGLPVPTSYENVQPFLEAVQYLIKQKKRAITIYPEAHIWPYYTKIRNFKRESFRYPVDLNAPCFAITNTYVRRKRSNKPRLVSFIDGPFYPNPYLDRVERIQDLRDRVYQTMIKRSLEREQFETIRYIKLDE